MFVNVETFDMGFERDHIVFALEFAEFFQVDFHQTVFLEDAPDLVDYGLEATGHGGFLDSGDVSDVAYVEVERERGFLGFVEPAERGSEVEQVALEEEGVEQNEETPLVLDVEVLTDSAKVLLEDWIPPLADLFKLLYQSIPNIFHSLRGDYGTFNLTFVLLEVSCVA